MRTSKVDSSLAHNLSGGHVCKKMFQSTLGVAKRFMRTTIEKADDEGIDELRVMNGKQKV